MGEIVSTKEIKEMVGLDFTRDQNMMPYHLFYFFFKYLFKIYDRFIFSPYLFYYFSGIDQTLPKMPSFPVSIYCCLSLLMNEPNIREKVAFFL